MWKEFGGRDTFSLSLHSGVEVTFSVVVGVGSLRVSIRWRVFVVRSPVVVPGSEVRSWSPGIGSERVRLCPKYGWRLGPIEDSWIRSLMGYRDPTSGRGLVVLGPDGYVWVRGPDGVVVGPRYLGSGNEWRYIGLRSGQGYHCPWSRRNTWVYGSEGVTWGHRPVPGTWVLLQVRKSRSVVLTECLLVIYVNPCRSSLSLVLHPSFELISL